MIGNVALDVVIGLVFVYLLYSLYATILMELIASTLKLRAKNLHYALARMLKDEAPQGGGARFFSKLFNTFTQVWGKSTNLEATDLHTNFYRHPAMKSLTNGGLNSKPSYISPAHFSKSVIDSLKTDDPDLSPLLRVEAGLELWQGNSETKNQIKLLLDEANNDLVKFRILLEQWYNDTMERATGWYKRTTQIILLFIGLAIAIAFNVDTLAIIRKLSTDKEAREQLVRMATEFTEKNSSLIQSIKDKGTASDTSVVTLRAKIDSLNKIKSMLESDMAKAQSIISSNWNIPDSIKIFPQPVVKIPVGQKQMQARVDAAVVYFLAPASLDGKILQKSLMGKSENGFVKVKKWRYKICYVFTWRHFWGYFLTVLALSLGAPFWFDLLNKLVKLRSSKAIATSSGGSETPIATNAPAVDRAILNRAG